MAYDKVVDSSVLDAGLKAIADAIREKGGTSDAIAFSAMAEAIAAIEAGGGNIAYGTITPSSTGTAVTITHNLGAVPTTGIFIKMTNDAASNTTDMYGLFQSPDTGIGIYSYKSSISLRNVNCSLTQAIASTYNFNRADANTVKTPTVIIAGKSYFWVLMV